MFWIGCNDLSKARQHSLNAGQAFVKSTLLPSLWGAAVSAALSPLLPRLRERRNAILPLLFFDFVRPFWGKNRSLEAPSTAGRLTEENYHPACTIMQQFINKKCNH
jgi:hypothetical protein